MAGEKISALEVGLKKVQNVVKALEVDAKADKEKYEASVAQEQERVAELTIDLRAARECVLHSERTEKEAVARLEVLNRRFPPPPGLIEPHPCMHHVLQHSYLLHHLSLCARSHIFAVCCVPSARVRAPQRSLAMS